MKIQRKESGGSGKTEIFEAPFRRRSFPFLLTAGKAKQILRLPKREPENFLYLCFGVYNPNIGKISGAAQILRR